MTAGAASDDRGRATFAAPPAPPHVQPHTSTICYLRALVPLVVASGLPERVFLARLGVDRRLLADVDARVPKETVVRAWELAAEATGSECIGLLSSLHAPLGDFPVLDHLAAHMPTVGEALRSLARYCRLCDAELDMRFDLLPGGGQVSLTFCHEPSRYSRHWAEWFVGLVLSRARALSAVPDLHPLSVQLQHPQPGRSLSLQTLLGCPPRYGRPATAIAFAQADLERPIPQASASMRKILQAHAERDLRLVAGDFRSRVRRILLEVLDCEPPSLPAVARRAGCSPRTLQARLQREKTSYAALLDDVRRELALRWLQDRDVRLMELALLLRFAEPSPFHRAFKRWTGQTPESYRRSALPLAEPHAGAPAPDAAAAAVVRTPGARR
jgi:AraC-like DNA-binding protein